MRGSVLPPCCTRGARHSPIIRTRACDRAGRRALPLDNARWVAPALQLPGACQRAGAPVPGQDAGDAHADAHDAGQLKFFNTTPDSPTKRTSFKRFIARLQAHRVGGLLQGKPFAGPAQVLRYLSWQPVTRRIVSLSRTAASLQPTTTRSRSAGRTIASTARAAGRTMRLHPHEFIERFLLHVLPKGFHRIRHYGLFASANRADSIATARALLNVAQSPPPRRKSSRMSRRIMPVPGAVRSHDRHRRLRALTTSRGGNRRRAAARPVMTQTSAVSVAAFPFRCAGSAPAAISSTPSHPPVRRSPR